MWPSLDAAQVYLVIQMGFQKIKKIYAMWLLEPSKQQLSNQRETITDNRPIK